MKLYHYIAAAVMATASFSSLAATQVGHDRAANLQSIGVVSVSGIAGSPDDAVSALKSKATEQGASYYRIIGLDNPGDSSSWRGNAVIYR